MADFKIKSDIKLDPAEALAQLAGLQAKFDEFRARLTQPIPIRLDVEEARKSIADAMSAAADSAAKTAAEIGKAADAATSAATSVGQTADAAIRTADAAKTAADNTKKIDMAAQAAKGSYSQLFVSVSKFILSKAGKLGVSLVEGIASGVRSSASLLRSAFSGVLSTVTGLFSGIRSIVGSAMGALDPASQMDQYGITMEKLLKNRGKAQARLAQLKTYARDTNFDIREVVEASNLMQAFGIHGNGLERLKLAGDAANAFHKDIREVVTSLNYLGSGRGGEAFESLARIGVTKEKLKPYGVQFNAQGALVTPTKKALNAVFKYFKNEYGGMTEYMGKTWAGSLKQLGGEWTTALADGLKGALNPLANFVTSDLIPAVRAFGQFLKSQDFAKALEGPLKMMSGIMMYARRVMDPTTRAQGWDELKNLGKAFAESGDRLMKAFTIIGEGFVGAIGKVFENFFGNGGMQSVLDAAYKGLLTVSQFFCDTFSIILSSFSDRFKSDLLMIVEKLPGGDNYETNRRRSADRLYVEEMLNSNENMQEIYSRRKGDIEKYGKQFWHNPGKLANMEERLFTDVVKEFLQNNKGHKVEYDSFVSEHMGWTDDTSKQANYDKTLARGKEFFSSVGTAFSINSQGVMQPIKDAAKKAGKLGILEPITTAVGKEAGFKQFDTAREGYGTYYDKQYKTVQKRYAGYQEQYRKAQKRGDYEGMTQAASLMDGASQTMQAIKTRHYASLKNIGMKESAYAWNLLTPEQKASRIRQQADYKYNSVLRGVKSGHYSSLGYSDEVQQEMLKGAKEEWMGQYNRAANIAQPAVGGTPAAAQDAQNQMSEEQRTQKEVQANTDRAASSAEDIDKKLVILSGQIASMNTLLRNILSTPQPA